MAIVDIEQVKKENKKKEDSKKEVVPVKVGDKTFFKGKLLDDYFDSYDECLNANIRAGMLKRNKEQGLNEHGQTKEQVKAIAKKMELVAEKAELLKEIKAIDMKISILNRGGSIEEKKPKKRKRK